MNVEKEFICNKTQNDWKENGESASEIEYAATNNKYYLLA